MDKNNKGKIHWNADTYSNIGGLNVFAKDDTKRIINVTNNKAFYYSKLAKKYKDEAKEACENAKYYAEQNSNLTHEQLIETRKYLEEKISEKQDAGDYLLAADLPANVSAFTNDANYTTESELTDAIDSVRLPEQTNNAGKFLQTDGESASWVKIVQDKLFDLKLFDRILSFEESKGYALQGTYVYKESAPERYGYPDFYAKCLEEKNSAEETTLTLGEESITVYKNANGHVFYDIANKEVIDGLFQKNGIAWYYGIDEENERIFLPRNNKFMQLTTDASKVNKFNAAGLPSLKGSIKNVTFDSYSASNVEGIFNSITKISNATDGTSAAEVHCNVTVDAANYNPIYGNSDTVQPPSLNQLLYIVVGNTEQTQAITGITEITTSENDTLPLGYSLYQGKGVQQSAAWLASKGQWNDGEIYTTFYNYAVNKVGEQFANGYIRESSEDYDDYDLVINQEDLTFRLPLLNGMEDLPSENSIDWTSYAISASTILPPAPANGWIVFIGNGVATEGFIINGTTKLQIGSGQAGSRTYRRDTVKVKKGDVATVYINNISGMDKIYFVYAQGNGTLCFKVANAVQNLELLDVGEVLESLADKTDKAQAAHASMPSKSYINLPLGVSGDTYKAPDDGFFALAKSPSANGQNMYLYNQTKHYGVGGSTYGTAMERLMLKVSKDDVIDATYTVAGATSMFRFIYANGTESEVN